MTNRQAFNITSALPLAQQNQLYQTLLERRPLVKELVEVAGHLSLVDYVADYYRSQLSLPLPSRQAEFLHTFSQFARNYFDKDLVAQISRQLTKYYSVSTADHQTPIFSHLAFQANVLTAGAYAQILDPIMRYVVVLGCSSVSLNHRDFPRGWLYHLPVNNELRTERIAIFSSKQRMHPVYDCAPYSIKQLQQAGKQISAKIKSGELTQALGNKLHELITHQYGLSVILNEPTYNAQIVRLNRALWPKLNPQPHNTELIYLDEEGLVANLLLEHHLVHPTALHRLLFDASVRDQLLPQLAAAMNSYLFEHTVGTDLFWAISPRHHHRVSLHLRDNVLVSTTPEEPLQFELTPTVIATALQQKRLMPNLMLCYTVLSLYYQLNCIGGFNQMSYITAMQAVYQASQCDPDFKAATTKAMHYGLMSAFLSYHDQAVAFDGLDQWLYGSLEFNQAWIEALSRVTIKQALTWLAPSLHRYLPVALQSTYDKTTLTKFITTDSIERSIDQPALLVLNH